MKRSQQKMEEVIAKEAALFSKHQQYIKEKIEELKPDEAANFVMTLLNKANTEIAPGYLSVGLNRWLN